MLTLHNVSKLLSTRQSLNRAVSVSVNQFIWRCCYNKQEPADNFALFPVAWVQSKFSGILLCFIVTQYSEWSTVAPNHDHTFQGWLYFHEINVYACLKHHQLQAINAPYAKQFLISPTTFAHTVLVFSRFWVTGETLPSAVAAARARWSVTTSSWPPGWADALSSRWNADAVSGTIKFIFAWNRRRNVECE